MAKATEAAKNLMYPRILGKTTVKKFGLELSEEKTRVIPFSPISRPGKTSFDFLGFEFCWGRDRTGKPNVKRRTARKNLRNSLKRFNEWCKSNRHERLPELFKQLNAKLQGYYQSYGVIGNFPSLMLFFYKAMRLLMKYLNRRSQRGSYNWAGFRQLIEQFGIVKPYITRRPKHYNRIRVAPVMA